MMEAKSRYSCTELFKILGILPSTAQYIYSKTAFVISNKEYFMETSNYMTLKLEITRNYFSHNKIYLSKGSSLCWHQDI